MPDPRAVRLVGVGASAGGVEALVELVAGLDPATDAAVLVVLHQPASAPTVLPHILRGHTALPVVPAEHGAPLEPGRIHLAVPDQHLTVRDGRTLLSRGPKENGHRPAIDPLLRSLAVAAGPGAVGIVLSGMLDDGAAGLLDVVRHGGAALVQDPAQALYPSMPSAALAQVPGALVRRAGELGATLRDVLANLPRAEPRPSHRASYELHMSGWDAARPTAIRRTSDDEGTGTVHDAANGSRAAVPGDATGPVDPADPTGPREAHGPGAPHDPDEDDPVELEPPGPAAGLSCPDCSGPLFDFTEGALVRYRCRVGHAWSLESLGAEQGRAIEVALYTALRALEDKASLQRRIAATADSHGAREVARRARLSAREALQSARAVRGLVTGALGSTGVSA